MSRPRLSLLAEASSQAIRSLSTRAPPPGGLLSPLLYHRIIRVEHQHKHKSRNVLLYGIPRTAQPVDVLRALRDQKLVSPDFSLGNVTPPVPSVPRTQSLFRTYHITMPSPDEASALFEHLRRNALFPDFDGPFRRSNLTLNDAKHFRMASMEGLERAVWTRERRRGSKIREGDEGIYFDRKGLFGPGYESKTDKGQGKETGELEELEAEESGEALEGGGKYSGRRVCLKGLSMGVSTNLVRIILAEEISGDARKSTREVGLVDGWRGVMRLPYSPNKQSSIFLLTFDTVTQAHRAARKLNMAVHTPLPSPVDGRVAPDCLMRAEVVW